MPFQKALGIHLVLVQVRLLIRKILSDYCIMDDLGYPTWKLLPDRTSGFLLVCRGGYNDRHSLEILKFLADYKKSTIEPKNLVLSIYTYVYIIIKKRSF